MHTPARAAPADGRSRDSGCHNPGFLLRRSATFREGSGRIVDFGGTCAPKQRLAWTLYGRDVPADPESTIAKQAERNNCPHRWGPQRVHLLPVIMRTICVPVTDAVAMIADGPWQMRTVGIYDLAGSPAARLSCKCFHKCDFVFNMQHPVCLHNASTNCETTPVKPGGPSSQPNTSKHARALRGREAIFVFRWTCNMSPEGPDETTC